MKKRTTMILASIPSSLVGLFLIFVSGLPKFFMTEGSDAEPFVRALGAWDILIAVGIIEVLCGVLLLIPRTFTVGFIITVGLLGGAMATGLTHTVEGNWPWFPLVLIGLLMISAWFKSPELLWRARGKKMA